MKFPGLEIEKVLFLDIETVPQYKSYKELPERFRSLWDAKAHTLSNENPPEEVYERAGIYAEFGKIICISTGFLNREGSDLQLRVKSFAGEDEKQLLVDFSNLVASHFESPYHYLCAHNGREFDFPYIARRLVINGLELPEPLDLAGKKPWEVRHLDTMQLWKFGDFKSYTSLDLLTAIFDIPTPKDDIKGSDVRRVYWEENGLDRIVTYCEKDVLALAQVFLRFMNKPLIKDENVIVV